MKSGGNSDLGFVPQLNIGYNKRDRYIAETVGVKDVAAKEKVRFFCQECGYESAKWLGKCPGCGSWNSFTEELVLTEKEKKPRAADFNLTPEFLEYKRYILEKIGEN